MEDADNTIHFLVLEPAMPVEPARITDQGVLEHIRLPLQHPLDVTVDAMGDAVAQVARQVDAIAAKVSTEQIHARLDEITVALAVSAGGGVQWVINLSGSAQATLSLTFKVQQPGHVPESSASAKSDS